MLPLLIVQPGQSLSGVELVGLIGWTLAKVTLFVGAMLFVGPGFPLVLVRIAHTRSRELFTLAFGHCAGHRLDRLLPAIRKLASRPATVRIALELAEPPKARVGDYARWKDRMAAARARSCSRH